jgi:hypothetical protein
MDLLTTYTHDSELQAITAPPLISTICKSPQHTLSLFQSAVFTNRSPAMASNRGDSSTSQTPVQNWRGHNSSARTTQKHPVFNSAFIIARRFVAAGTCLPSRCWYIRLPRGRHIVTALHATT